MRVILSIKPKYVEEIKSGRKKYEFRRAIFKKGTDVEEIYIYSTSPIKKIVGAFEIDDILAEHPKSLWKRCKEYSGIDEHSFFKYFSNKEIGFAIKIKNLNIFDEPVDPKEAIPNFTAPQSFRYVEQNLMGM